MSTDRPQPIPTSRAIGRVLWILALLVLLFLPWTGIWTRIQSFNSFLVGLSGEHLH